MEQIILPKNIFLPHFEIVQNFHYFVTSAPVDFLSKFNFPKTPSNVVEMLLLMSGTNNFAKKYFLTPFWDSTKFSLFCKVRACRFSVKNSIFPKTENRQARTLQNSENFVLSQNGVRKYFLAKLFVPLIKRNKQIILPKNIFLPHFWIVQIFTIL